MKQGFYIFFYKRIRIEWICVVLATLAYFLYCAKYFLKRLFAPSRIVTLDASEARDIISRLYPRTDEPVSRVNLPLDDSIDLSVIMPIYNYEDLIGQTIDAALNQKTRFNYELILVDDGSDQPAKEILKRYKDDPRVRVIHRENGGIGAARNTGLDNARGRYYMFIDCDDIVHEDIVETLMSVAVEKDLDMVMCGHNLSKQADGRVLSVTPNIYPKYNLMRYKDGDYLWNFPGLPWCKVYKREIFDSVRFIPGYWYEDTIIHFLAFRFVKSFEYIPKVKYEYRWYEKNFSHIQSKAPDRSVQRYWILERCIEETEAMGLPRDVVFYKLLLRHLGSFYYNTFANMDSDAVDAMFVLGSELLKKYKPIERYRLPYALKQIERALLSRDIERWKLATTIQ
ncbi:MAG: glycosyltransferase family 2 protein [Clostridia bacterium]|nr:glycosyltransferase family 2 protein [Clostridia bacterium]